MTLIHVYGLSYAVNLIHCCNALKVKKNVLLKNLQISKRKNL